ncbi:DNA cytosine methyltransferase [Rickettsia rhipicephali]|uniref:DNA cytosine methyltransferase n=1 Tax=Rickettsia rhipicephali TaxID=33992 RepID=UPI002B1CD419|nr:DNA cytosine methyltransferase [Rickettsia rhipicephali]
MKGFAALSVIHFISFWCRCDLYYINDKIRRLTINECKYLMGFPQDHYVADGLKGYRQFSNSTNNSKYI